MIDQSRDNTRAISLADNASDRLGRSNGEKDDNNDHRYSTSAGISGAIYAPNALLSLSGNAGLKASLVVGTLKVGDDAALTQIAAGSDGSGDVATIGSTLRAGDLNVYVNDPNGLFTSDELARISDAIAGWDTLLAPYSVAINQVTDPTLANIVIDTGTTSASGDAADGVLGCYNGANSEITLLQGWNWYAGSDRHPNRRRPIRFPDYRDPRAGPRRSVWAVQSTPTRRCTNRWRPAWPTAA